MAIALNKTHTFQLDLSCHVRSGADAKLTVTVDGTDHKFTVAPTIDWVDSSSPEGANVVSVNLLFDKVESFETMANTYKFKILAEDSDVLICRYDCQAPFHISSQPVWSNPSFKAYDITGHGSDESAYTGNGSLQIPKGMFVEFDATVTNKRRPPAA